MIENKKTSIILILKVLKEYSDEDHYLTQKNIIDKIRELYGVELERKSVASSLSLLQDLDYDINKSPKGGYALLSRELDNTEIRFIADALFSSKSLSGKQSRDLINKLNHCLSRYQRRNYNHIYKCNDFNRNSNSELFFTLDLIEEAKKRGKKISFQYLSFDENGRQYVKRNGFRYIVSPYYSVNSGSRYYLICNYNEKYRPIQSFRLDYIINAQIEEDKDLKPLESLEGMSNFDISTYLNDNIYLLNGDVITARIRIDEPHSVQFVMDWFGRNAKIYKKDGILYADIKCNESALFYWYMQYSETLTLISPQSLIDRVKNEAKNICKKLK